MPTRRRRIAVIGNTSVGKSAVTVRYVEDRFVAEYAPTIETLFRKQTRINDIDYDLDIIDTAGMAAGTETVPRIIVGNKCDLDDSNREVPKVEVERLAAEWKCPWIECSARSGNNIDTIFKRLLTEIERVLNPGQPQQEKKCILL